ncbi:hypothetical protein ACFX1R_003414 [Malus domestica]
MESALIIFPFSRLSSSRARQVFSELVGPDTITTFSFPLFLVVEIEQALVRRRRRRVKVSNSAVRKTRFFDEDVARGKRTPRCREFFFSDTACTNDSFMLLTDFTCFFDEDVARGKRTPRGRKFFFSNTAHMNDSFMLLTNFTCFFDEDMARGKRTPKGRKVFFSNTARMKDSSMLFTDFTCFFDEDVAQGKRTPRGRKLGNPTFQGDADRYLRRRQAQLAVEVYQKQV